MRARAHARLGRLDEAETLASRQWATPTGRIPWVIHANALLVLAEILRLRPGRSEEAVPLVDEAIALFDLKGNVVSAARARALLE